MRFYTGQHQYDCGIDLHARTMYLCILHQQVRVGLHGNVRCDPELFLESGGEAVSPTSDSIRCPTLGSRLLD
jgi:hypothetical protein